MADWKSNSDQTRNCPRDLRLSVKCMGVYLGPTLNLSVRYCCDVRGALKCSPMMPKNIRLCDSCTTDRISILGLQDFSP